VEDAPDDLARDPQKGDHRKPDQALVPKLCPVEPVHTGITRGPGRCPFVGEPVRAPNEAPEPQKIEQMAEWAAGRRFDDIPADNFAATLAAAGMAGASRRQFLTALATASQVHAIVSQRAPLQEKGFDHVTHLAFSIPAGCINALGLDRRQGANAIALCACAT